MNTKSITTKIITACNSFVDKKIKSLIIILLLFSFISCQINENSDFEILQKETKENLQFLDKYVVSEKPDFDIDSFGILTAEKLVRLLTFTDSRKLNLKEYGHLELSAFTNDSFDIHIYNFYYYTGGSTGSRDYSVIQWKNKNNKLFAYHLTEALEWEFIEIYKLNSNSANLFILLGSTQVTANQYIGLAKVIQLNDSNINLDYPAFINKPEFEIWSNNLSFDTLTETLSFGLQEMEKSDRNLKMYDSVTYRKIFKVFEKNKELDENGCSLVKLKFNGKKFIE